MQLNPRKTILQPVDRGVDFVGHLIKPWCRRTRPRTVANALTRLQATPQADLHQVGNAYFGLLRQAPASHTDRALVANLLRRRGKSVSAGLTKTFKGTA